MTVDDVYSDDVIEGAARAAHEANRAYCIALGDYSQQPWVSAPLWQKTSARKGVEGVVFFNNTPRESHESWLKEKEATGWGYGPVKNELLKEHPCFVPYDELPATQKVKDEIFVNVVKTVSNAIIQAQLLRDEK